MKNIGYFYAIAAAVTWGLAYTLDEKVLERFSPVQLLILHALVTLVIAVPVAMSSPEGVRGILTAGKGQWVLVMLSVVLSIGASWLIFTSIQMLGAPTASIFEISYPFFVVVFSLILFRTPVTIPLLVGGVLVFAGSYVIIRGA